MTVYIEYALIDNFIIDYILIKSAFALIGFPKKRKRLFLCSSLCSIFALLCPMITINKVLSSAIKILFLLLTTSLCFKYNDKKEYLYFISTFLLLTFLSGGAIIGVYNLLNLDYNSEISIAVMSLPVYFIVKFFGKVIKFIKRRKISSENFYKVELILGDISIETVGFFDTGNSVYDEDNPVIFCDETVAKKFLDPNGLPRLKRIEVDTVTGRAKLLSFRLDSIVIYYGDKPNIYNKVRVCVCKRVGLGCGVILHPSLIEGGEYETKKPNQKIS